MFFSSRKWPLLMFLALSALHAQGFSGELVLPTGLSDKRLAIETLWQGVAPLPVGERPRVIVVLGGGGARGLSHIGVLRVFEEERIPIDQLACVSVGALIGALYASGLSVDHIEAMTREVGWDKLTDLSKVRLVQLIVSETLLSTHRMEIFLDEHIKGKTFADLNIPFSCLATDMRTGEAVVFREGPVALAARASATLPAFFKPVAYRQRLLVDGGLIDNLPTEITLSQKEDLVVGVLPVADLVSSEPNTVFKSLIRTIEIQKDSLLEKKRKGADFMIEPNVGSVTFLDLGRARECIVAGTLAARSRALELKEVIIRRVLEKRRAGR